jgi:glutamate--cysteine ligase
VSYNGLEGYAASLHEALTRPYPPYEALGVFNPGGEYNQLATSLLQIENEFYGTIRPKRVIRPGERPLHALRERGVEYVEVRCMDLDPFEPVGIGAGTIAFLDVFLLHCLLSDSPPDTPQEIAALARNQQLVAERGREPGLLLQRGGREVALEDWSARQLEECTPSAAVLDACDGGAVHREALESARASLRDPLRLPSARVLDAMRSEHASTQAVYEPACSRRSREQLMQRPFTDESRARFARLASESLEEQRRIEAAETVPFEEFRQAYLSPQQLLV